MSVVNLADVLEPGMIECQPNIEDGTSLLISRVANTIIVNGQAIALFSLVVLVTGFVMVYCVRSTWTTMRRYWDLKAATSRSYPPPVVMSAGADDNVPLESPMTADGLDASLGPAADAKLLRSKMDRLKARYTAYNRALNANRARLGKDDDDVIDARVLARDNDNFYYTGGNRERDRHLRKRTPSLH